MALSKQPEIPNVPITLIPDDKPNANISKGINPNNPKIMVVQPIAISILPTFIIIRQLNCFEVFTRNPYIH